MTRTFSRSFVRFSVRLPRPCSPARPIRPSIHSSTWAGGRSVHGARRRPRVGPRLAGYGDLRKFVRFVLLSYLPSWLASSCMLVSSVMTDEAGVIRTRHSGIEDPWTWQHHHLPPITPPPSPSSSSSSSLYGKGRQTDQRTDADGRMGERNGVPAQRTSQ